MSDCATQTTQSYYPRKLVTSLNITAYRLCIVQNQHQTNEMLWEMDIEEDGDMMDQNGGFLRAQKQTMHTRFKLPQYRRLLRTYISPVKTHHMSAITPDVCKKNARYFLSTVHGNVHRSKTSGRKLLNFCQSPLKCQTPCT